MFKTRISELANKIKLVDENISNQLLGIAKNIFYSNPNNQSNYASTGFHVTDSSIYISNCCLTALQALVALIDTESFQSKLKVKKSKIFISHSSDDALYVGAFVSMLEKMRIETDHLFCSSIQGFKIPLGKNIYDYLRRQFEEYNLYVIMMLSKSYYNSYACLNEMGAAWVLKADYQAILLPQFSFKDVDGAIDPRDISFKLDNLKERSGRLSELKNTIVNKLELSYSDDSIWERHKAEFLEAVDKIHTDMLAYKNAKRKTATNDSPPLKSKN